MAYEPKISQTRYIHKHDYDPTAELWYPMPPCESSHSLEQPRGIDTLLCYRTQRTRAFLGQSLSRRVDLHLSVSIRNSQGTWIGELPLHDNKLLTQILPKPPNSEMGDLCELVAISQGYFYEKWKWSIFVIGK